MPIKSLISDRLNRVKDLRINAADLSSGMTDDIREGISSSKYFLVFASPESLLGDAGHELFKLCTHQDTSLRPFR